MKTTLDRADIPVPGKPVQLHFRYPTIRETRRMEDVFGKTGEDAFAGYVAAINSILTGWSGEGTPCFTGSVEDILSEIDVLFLRNSLLNDLSMAEIEMKKAFLFGASKPANLETPAPSTAVTH